MGRGASGKLRIFRSQLPGSFTHISRPFQWADHPCGRALSWKERPWEQWMSNPWPKNKASHGWLSWTLIWLYQLTLNITISPFYRWGHWGTKTFSGLSKVIWHVSSGSRVYIWFSVGGLLPLTGRIRIWRVVFPRNSPFQLLRETQAKGHPFTQIVLWPGLG